MARDAKGRWLPLEDKSAPADDGRHRLSLLDCRKGFQAMLDTPMPSRKRASIRKRITGRYRSKNHTEE